MLASYLHEKDSRATLTSLSPSPILNHPRPPIRFPISVAQHSVLSRLLSSHFHEKDSRATLTSLSLRRYSAIRGRQFVFQSAWLNTPCCPACFLPTSTRRTLVPRSLASVLRRYSTIRGRQFIFQSAWLNTPCCPACFLPTSTRRTLVPRSLASVLRRYSTIRGRQFVFQSAWLNTPCCPACFLPTSTRRTLVPRSLASVFADTQPSAAANSFSNQRGSTLRVVPPAFFPLPREGLSCHAH